MKKLLTLLVAGMVAGVLGAVLLPAVAAQASAEHGGFAGCYGIRKKGNYNNVRLGVTGVIRGKQVAASGVASVTYKCQRVNSLPVIKMVVDRVRLVKNGKTVAVAGTRATGTKPKVSQHTRFVPAPCGANFRVYATFHYEYYDKSQVRPFAIHGPSFSRC